MYADIIPTQKMPRNLSVLSYTIPPNLEKKVALGQLVTIPLRNSVASGIIVHLAKNKHFNYPLKNIIAPVSLKPIFTQTQLKLFTYLASYYSVSTSLFIHFNLPKILTKEWSKLPKIKNTPSKTKRPKKTSYFWWTYIKNQSKFYLSHIKKNKGQLLIVVPRRSDISLLATQLGLSEKEYIPMHRKLTRSQNFKLYSQTLAKQKSIFIGTRSCLFYPFQNLKTIIIDAEDSLDHKQYDMNPRYDVAIVAERLSQLSGAELIYSSSSPSLWQYHTLLPKPATNLKKDIKLIDLNNLITLENYSFISDELISSIKHARKLKKNIFIFVNRKGESTTTTCQDCNYTFDCPTCQLPLVKTSSNKLICYYCSQTQELPPFCPKCSGPNFHSTGLGIQKIEKNLKKIFPDIPIKRIDKDSIKTPAIKNNHSTIIIGTEFALDKIDWSRIHTLGLINASALYKHPEFNSTESAYQLLAKILTLAKKNANIIIQTFDPNHYIFRALKQNKPAIFYNQELKFRKQFSYPPFVNLVKLSYLNKSEATAEKQAQKIYQKLANLKSNYLSPPLPITRRKIRGQFKYNIIIKLKNLDDLQPMIKQVPTDWLIDIHPRGLLD